MKKIQLWPQEPLLKDGLLELAATVEKYDGENWRLWFRLPGDTSPALTGNADPFVLAILFHAMETPADLEIHGEVSPSLVRNLEEFQKAWALWRPEKYHPVEITASSMREQSPLHRKEVAMGFSGGVDSAFTAWQYRPGMQNLPGGQLTTGIMVHGFDIPIDQPNIFARAAEKARLMLASIGMDLITISTNVRALGSDWSDSHGAVLAASMLFFQKRFNTGLIASSYPYNDLVIPYGSSPLTDHLLTNDTFPIVHHGATHDRFEKIRQISQWAEARQYLRVCWSGSLLDRNCCRCIKCVAAMLIFRAVGQGSLPAFPSDISDRDILHMKYNDIRSMRRYIRLLSAQGFNASTIRALQMSVRINKLRLAAMKIPRVNKLIRRLEYRWFLDPDLAFKY